MDDLILKLSTEARAFVDEDARGGAGAGDDEVRDNAGVILAPVAAGNFGLNINPLSVPASAGHFIGVAVVTVLHHEVDAHTAITVVVVVALEDVAERIGDHFVVIAEIIPEYFEIAQLAVGVISPEGHPLLVGLALGVDSVAGEVFDVRRAIADVGVEVVAVQRDFHHAAQGLV